MHGELSSEFSGKRCDVTYGARKRKNAAPCRFDLTEQRAAGRGIEDQESDAGGNPSRLFRVIGS